MLLFSATLKAVDAAVNSRQWLKAVQILEVLPVRPEVQMYYKKIAQHHANMGEYEVKLMTSIQARESSVCLLNVAALCSVVEDKNLKCFGKFRFQLNIDL